MAMNRLAGRPAGDVADGQAQTAGIEHEAVVIVATYSACRFEQAAQRETLFTGEQLRGVG
jgi:hypothetical protein